MGELYVKVFHRDPDYNVTSNLFNGYVVTGQKYNVVVKMKGRRKRIVFKVVNYRRGKRGPDFV